MKNPVIQITMFADEWKIVAENLCADHEAMADTPYKRKLKRIHKMIRGSLDKTDGQPEPK